MGNCGILSFIIIMLREFMPLYNVPVSPSKNPLLPLISRPFRLQANTQHNHIRDIP